MERELKLKSKLSYSPSRAFQKVFTMRARIGKKSNPSNTKIPLEPISYINQKMSPSAHKAKVFSSKLFSGAHKIESRRPTWQKRNFSQIARPRNPPTLPVLPTHVTTANSQNETFSRAAPFLRWKESAKEQTVSSAGKTDDRADSHHFWRRKYLRRLLP